MKTLTIEMLNGKTKTFRMSSDNIAKILITLENVDTKWLLIENFRVRPEHIVAAFVD